MLLILILAGLSGCTPSPSGKETTDSKPPVSETTVNQTIEIIRSNKKIIDLHRFEKGVKHAASLWRSEDGSADDFTTFCKLNYIDNDAERELFFDKVSRNFESLLGHFNKISLDLKENIDLNNGPLLNIDNEFSAYSVGSHLLNDFYSNKIAFSIALNFPYYTLEEKEKFGNSYSRKSWAMARLGDIFVSRVPSVRERSFVDKH